jgi:hypothetical protein
VSAAQLARTWSLLAGGFFDGAGLTTTDRGPTIELRRRVDGQSVVCSVDRATLTPRRYSLVDPQGQERFTLSMDRYAVTGGIPWAHRLTAVSGDGRVVVNLSSVEINGEIGPDAFRPPRRAEKLP